MPRFGPTGEFLALASHAWGAFYDAPRSRENERRGDVIVVTVRGPLMHHREWCDSYDEIRDRVGMALAEKPAAVVLAIDSPGGLVSGCFDTADEIRAACAAASVPLYAFVDGAALSAGYALACAASRIVVPSTGIVGSIGVMDLRIDATAQDRAMGISATGIAVGDRKLDGNPHVPLSDEELAATRARQEILASLFFAHVATARRVGVDDVRALKAGLVIGASAVPMLADEVMSLDQMIAAIAAGTFGAPQSASGDTTMSSKAYEEAIANLRKMAASDGPEAAKAKRMLKAELEEDAEPDEEPAKAEGEAPAKKDEKDASAAKAKAESEDMDEPAARAAEATASSALSEARAARAAAEGVARDMLIATRPDFDDATKKMLAKASLEDVREFVASAPRRALKPAATAVVGGTRAHGQEDRDSAGLSALPPDERAALDQQMGLASAKAAPSFVGNLQTFPAMTRAQRAEWLATRAKAQENATR